MNANRVNRVAGSFDEMERISRDGINPELIDFYIELGRRERAEAFGNLINGAYRFVRAGWSGMGRLLRPGGGRRDNPGFGKDKPFQEARESCCPEAGCPCSQG